MYVVYFNKQLISGHVEYVQASATINRHYCGLGPTGLLLWYIARPEDSSTWYLNPLLIPSITQHFTFTCPLLCSICIPPQIATQKPAN